MHLLRLCKIWILEADAVRAKRGSGPGKRMGAKAVFPSPSQAGTAAPSPPGRGPPRPVAEASARQLNSPLQALVSKVVGMVCEVEHGEQAQRTGHVDRVTECHTLQPGRQHGLAVAPRLLPARELGVSPFLLGHGYLANILSPAEEAV